jgi:hypothetical protein
MDTSASLIVGVNRTGYGMTTTGWPNGAGFTHYKWRLDGIGAWSAETAIGTPISISGLSSGPHFVQVTGKRDSGLYQDDALFGEDALVTTSRTWTVSSELRIDSISLIGPNTVEIQFTAQPNTGYTILDRDSLSSGTWQPLVHVDPTPSSHLVQFDDSPPPNTSMRFYRISTP